MAHEALEQLARGRVDVHETVAGAGDVIARRAALGVGHVEHAAQILDVERCVAARNVAVLEGALPVLEHPAAVEDVNLARGEVGSVEPAAARAGRDRQALVFGPGYRGDIHRHRDRQEAALPGVDEPVLGREDEERGCAANHECGASGEDLTGRRAVGDGHCERHFRERNGSRPAAVERRVIRAVVRDPQWRGRAEAHAPGVDEAGIGDLSDSRHVRNQVGLDEARIVAVVAVMGRHRDRHRGRRERCGGDHHKQEPGAAPQWVQGEQPPQRRERNGTRGHEWTSSIAPDGWTTWAWNQRRTRFDRTSESRAAGRAGGPRTVRCDACTRPCRG